MSNTPFATGFSTGSNTAVPAKPRRISDRDITSIASIQQSIRWDHFIQGRLAIEWGNIINNHISNKPTIKQNAEDWGTKLLKINWKYILELWNVRNDEVKGSNLEERTEQQSLPRHGTRRGNYLSPKTISRSRNIGEHEYQCINFTSL
jgi:hypothetical protein